MLGSLPMAQALSPGAFNTNEAKAKASCLCVRDVGFITEGVVKVHK